MQSRLAHRPKIPANALDCLPRLRLLITKFRSYAALRNMTLTLRTPTPTSNPLKVNNAHGSSTGTGVGVGVGTTGLITLMFAAAVHWAALVPPDLDEHCVVVVSGVACAVLVNDPGSAVGLTVD